VPELQLTLALKQFLKWALLQNLVDNLCPSIRLARRIHNHDFTLS
jgi:hypothetical protein